VRRHVSKRKNNVWTVVLLDGVAIPASGLVSSDIVSPSDWERSASGKEEATVLTVRGWLSYVNKLVLADNNPNGVFQYVGIQDEDISTSPTPTAASTYTEEDIMWTGGHLFPFESSDGSSHTTEFNIKAQRRITSGQDLRHVMEVGAGSDLLVSGVIRALLRISG